MEDPVRVIDARGLAVCPGFIDLHSHSDLILSLDADRQRALQRGKLLQGITTEIAGNCGLGAAPCGGAGGSAMRGLIAWMTPRDARWTWSSFPEYLDAIDRPLALNAGCLAPHGPARAAVMGLDARTAGRAERAAMAEHLREALAAGAFGVSVGLIYAPGQFADTDELVDVARPVADAEGIFASHVRGSSETLLPAVAELLEIGREAGCRVHHSHTEAVGPEHWGKVDAVLDMEDAARRRGPGVTCDLFPYHAAATTMAAIFPPWALEGGIPALLSRIENGGARARMREDVETVAPVWPAWGRGAWPHNLVRACGYERIVVARTGGATGGAYDGLSLVELGRRRGTHPFDAVCDLMIEEQGEVGQWVFGITGEDGEDRTARPIPPPRPEAQSTGAAGAVSHGGAASTAMDRLLESPFCAVATDACDYGSGLPHPAAYGSFPRVLARFVRQRKILSFAEAVRRMTTLPAAILGLRGRGRIAAGEAADIVVLDPETVADTATFSSPRSTSRGIVHVLVNGTHAVARGEVTGRDGGRLLRRT